MISMKAVRSLVAAVVALVVFALPTVVLADGRVALVVGNSTYAHIGRLPNPDNDAADMSAALARLGFEVTTEFDADRVELTETLRAFTQQSAGADVSLVFYAGHGIEMDGVNYLVPVDARLERDVDVRFETVTVDDLLVSTSGASLRLVILDACRNNPLARSMQRTAATRTVSGGSFADLNEDLLGDETLVAYAAAAGTTAADGRGPEQSVHRGAAVAPGDAVGDRAAVPSGTGAGIGGDQRCPASARVPLAGGRALPDEDARNRRVDDGQRRDSSRSGTGRLSTARPAGD